VAISVIQSDFNRRFVYFRFGQFIVSTLPQMSASEKNLVLNGIKVSCGESSENDWIYSASSLKQQPADRHIASLAHIILILSQPVFALFP
jgi:hypothetical protein